MGNVIWMGGATAVAQVTTVTVGGTLAGETFTISVGGVAIASHTDTDTVIATTVADLVSDWNASTHAYATGITAADASPDITLTADTAGVPFVVTLNTPGGSATFTQAATTPSAGPHDWSTAANWQDEAVPVNSDDVYIQDSSQDILWGLDQNGVSLTSLNIAKSFTGKIGLKHDVFATTEDAATTATGPLYEYRQEYLKIVSTTVNIGEHNGPGNPNGSGRIKLDTHTTASTITIHGTASAPSETNLYAVQLLAASASTVIHVRDAPGGVGLAKGVAGETSTVSKVSVSSTSSNTRVDVGAGTTITTWEQFGGTNAIRAAATITTCDVNGGTLTTNGSYVITTTNVNAGTYNSNHISGSVSHTTINLNGGTTNAQGNSESRTWTTVNIKPGATLKGDSDFLTITTLNETGGQAGGKYTLACS